MLWEKESFLFLSTTYLKLIFHWGICGFKNKPKFQPKGLISPWRHRAVLISQSDSHQITETPADYANHRGASTESPLPELRYQVPPPSQVLRLEHTPPEIREQPFPLNRRGLKSTVKAENPFTSMWESVLESSFLSLCNSAPNRKDRSSTLWKPLLEQDILGHRNHSPGFQGGCFYLLCCSTLSTDLLQSGEASCPPICALDHCVSITEEPSGDPWTRA